MFDSSIIGTEFSGSLSYLKIDGNNDIESKIIEEYSKGNAKKIDEEHIEKMKELKKNENGIFGRSKGVLSLVVNSLNSGSVYVNLIATINSAVGSSSISLAIFIVICGAILFAFSVFNKKCLYCNI